MDANQHAKNLLQEAFNLIVELKLFKNINDKNTDVILLYDLHNWIVDTKKFLQESK